MKFSNCLLLFLAGTVLVFISTFLFTDPAANLVAYSWWIAFSFIVSSIVAIFLSYFSVPKSFAHLFIFSKISQPALSSLPRCLWIGG